MLLFSLTVTVTPTFYFIILMITTSSITEKKNYQNSMATFLANEINTTEGDIVDPTAQVKIIFPLKDKILQGDICSGS